MIRRALIFLGLALFPPDSYTSEQTMRDHLHCQRISELNGADHPSQPAQYRECLLAHGWIERPIYRQEEPQ